MAALPPITPITPKATMEEAWAESDRKWAEGKRLRAKGGRLWYEGRLVVVLTAQALYGKDCLIDWKKRTVAPFRKEK